MPQFLGIDDDILQKKILPNALRAGIEPTFVNAFSKSGISGSNGTGDAGSRNAVIHRENVQSGDGQRYVVPLVREINYKDRIYDNEEVTGNEQDVSFYSDSVTIHSIDTAVKLGQRELIKLSTPVQIESYLTSLTSTAVRRGLEWDVWRAATIGTYAGDSATNAGFAASKPVYDRIVYSHADGTQPTRNTYDGYAGMTAAFAYQDAVQLLNVKTIDLMKMYAEQGGATPEAEDIISAPETYIANGVRADEYILFIDPLCVPGLYADPRWNAHQTRGVVVKDAPQSITGTKMLGMVDGVRVYVNPWLAKFRITSAAMGGIDNRTFCWNILCGAGGIHLGTYKAPAFYYKEEDYNKQYGITLREFRGQKALLYPSKTTAGRFAEYGIIHNITRVV